MNKLWLSISNIGLTDNSKDLLNRSKILLNQINFILFLILLITSLINIVNSYLLGDGPIALGTFRLFMLMGINVIIFVLNFKGYFYLSKILFIFLPGLILLIIPTLFHFVEVESFFYYPIWIIGFGILPQIILIPKVDKLILGLSLVYHFIFLVFLFDLIKYFSPEPFYVIDVISEFILYYKLMPIIIYIALQAIVYYLRQLNINYEEHLEMTNSELNNTVTELKFTQQYMVQSEKMASLGTLSLGVAHEINNPLNYINGGLQIMENTRKKIENYSIEELKARCTEAAEVIESGVEKVSYIVNSLTTFSDSGFPELQSADIEELIDRTLIFLKSSETDDIQFIKEYKFDSETEIYQAKFLNAVYNIFENAVEAVYSNENEKIINIKTFRSEDFVIISIFNNGPKIPEEYISQIFDPFFTTKDPGKGIGLGLSICYTLVSEHDGTVTAKNVENGVEFTIKLPIN